MPISGHSVQLWLFFSAEVLDEDLNVYTTEDDEFFGLTIKSCVALPPPDDGGMIHDRSWPLKKSSRPAATAKGLKKRLRKKGRKHLRRRGKKFCCKKGIQAMKAGRICTTPEPSIVDKAFSNFGIKTDACLALFTTCCQHKVVGAETYYYVT